MERLEKTNLNFDKELSIDMVLNSFPSSYDRFILTYYLNISETILIGLLNVLQTVEKGMKKFHFNNVASPLIVAIQQGKGKKRNAHS